MTMFFTQIYIYDNNNKNIYMLIYKKSLKKCLRLFHKTFSNFQATSKSDNFSQSERGLTPPLPLIFFICSLRTPSLSTTNSGFPAGFENMGGAPMGGGALQYLIGGSKVNIWGKQWGRGGLKFC